MTLAKNRKTAIHQLPKNQRLQVLMSVMGQNDHSILKKTNIHTSAIIINQSNQDKVESFKYKKRDILFFTTTDRGIGISRNTALMKSDADICIFADDDISYVEKYDQIIINEFRNNIKADVILFNVPSLNQDRPSCKISKAHRVRRYNCLRYGAPNIAFRNSSIINANIYFSRLFGGGAQYSSGEDSLFLYTAIKSGLRVYASTEVIGYSSQESSTWFQGYNDKYFIDKGALFKHLSPSFAHFLGLQYVIRKRNVFKSSKTIPEAIKLINTGIARA